MMTKSAPLLAAILGTTSVSSSGNKKICQLPVLKDDMKNIASETHGVEQQ